MVNVGPPIAFCLYGLRNRDECALCAQDVETLDHLLVVCVFSRKTWFRVLSHVGLGNLAPTNESPLVKWWTQARKSIDKIQRKGFDSLVYLVAWSLCKERNRRAHSSDAGGFGTDHYRGSSFMSACGLCGYREGFVS